MSSWGHGCGLWLRRCCWCVQGECWLSSCVISLVSRLCVIVAVLLLVCAGQMLTEVLCRSSIRKPCSLAMVVVAAAMLERVRQGGGRRPVRGATC